MVVPHSPCGFTNPNYISVITGTLRDSPPQLLYSHKVAILETLLEDKIHQSTGVLIPAWMRAKNGRNQSPISTEYETLLIGSTHKQEDLLQGV